MPRHYYTQGGGEGGTVLSLDMSSHYYTQGGGEGGTGLSLDMSRHYYTQRGGKGGTVLSLDMSRHYYTQGSGEGGTVLSLDMSRHSITPRGRVLRYISDRQVWRPFWGLKSVIWDFFGFEIFWSTFLEFKKCAYLRILNFISNNIIVSVQFRCSRLSDGTLLVVKRSQIKISMK